MHRMVVDPVAAIRGLSRDDRERERDGRDTNAEAGFGPAVIVSLRGKDGAQPRSEPEAQPGELLPEEQEMVKELEARDREVRTHEMAHLASGGQYASGPSYTYQTGPDGRRYAIGGEVQIDTSPGKTPEETIRKMDVVKRAALAPAEPSAQDMRVAQLADQKRNEAQMELNRQRTDEMAALAGGGDGGAGRFAAAAAAYGGAAKLIGIAGGGTAGGSAGLF